MSMTGSLPVTSLPEPGAGDFGKRHQALAHPYTLSSNPLLERQAQQETGARSYPRRIPLALKRARGIYVEDIEGRVFIDCLAGAGTLALGHNHPVVMQAMHEVLRDELPLLTLDLTTPVKDRFVQDLLGILPAEFSRNARIQFCGPSGSDAIEAALKLVKTATGRNTLLAFHGAYHGMTQGALSLMGNLAPKRALPGLGGAVQFLPYPHDYRCPFGLSGRAGEQAGLRYIESVLNDPQSGVTHAAGMVIEAVQGEGGVNPAPDAWLRSLRDMTTHARVPLILDEVQTGLGRTGRFFAFEHAGIVPDVVVLAKAIGGSLPLAVMVYRDELDDCWKPGAHAGTFRGNQMAMAAGSATIRFVQSEALHQRAETMGQRLRNQLLELRGHYPQIGNVRGRGLMLGVEIVDPEGKPDNLGHPPQAGALAASIQTECLRRGLIIELGGRFGSVARFLPPLIITEQQIDHVASIFAAALQAVVRDRLPDRHAVSAHN